MNCILGYATYKKVMAGEIRCPQCARFHPTEKPPERIVPAWEDSRDCSNPRVSEVLGHPGHWFAEMGSEEKALVRPAEKLLFSSIHANGSASVKLMQEYFKAEYIRGLGWTWRLTRTIR